jgi:hypothetical protein
MKGKTWISKLSSRFYKFEDDVNYKKRGGRTSTKPWAKIAKAKLKSLFRKQIKEELYGKQETGSGIN